MRRRGSRRGSTTSRLCRQLASWRTAQKSSSLPSFFKVRTSATALGQCFGLRAYQHGQVRALEADEVLSGLQRVVDLLRYRRVLRVEVGCVVPCCSLVVAMFHVRSQGAWASICLQAQGHQAHVGGARAGWLRSQGIWLLAAVYTQSGPAAKLRGSRVAHRIQVG